jgi:pyruvate kinase
MESASVTQSLIKALKARGVVKPGDKLIRTKGDLTGASGGTNSLKVITVTD